MRYPLRVRILPFESGRSGWGRWVIGLLLACCWPCVVRAQATLTASLEPPSIAVGEDSSLRVVVENGSADAPPSFPQVAGLRITSAGTSQEMSIINFHQSLRTVFTYRLTGLKAGSVGIPPVRVTVGGKTLSTQPLKLEVRAANTPPPGADPDAPKEVFLKLGTARPKVYVGEPFLVDITLYTLVGGQLIEEPQLPDAGFTMGKMVKLPTTTAAVGSQNYNLVTYRRLMTATRPGKTSLGPATMAFNAEKRNRGFFEEPFRRVEMVSDRLEVEVRPLPAKNAPASFAGAIGNFGIRCSISPTNLAVGDPITVLIQIAGRGTFDSLRLPEQANWREFKVYPASSHAEPQDEYGQAGTNTFEQVVVPQNAEIKAWPGLEFSFFNPESGKYTVLHTPAIPITVKATAATPQPSLAAGPGAGGAEPGPANDIVHIKPDFGSLAQITRPLVLRGWFWALQCSMPLAWAGLAVWRWREEKLAGNPRLMRRKQVDRLVRESMGELARLAAAGEAGGFHASAFRLLQERLGERLDLPAAAITEAVIEERLRRDGVEKSLPPRLHELFQILNKARYAPDSVSTQLPGVLSRLKSVLDDLERIKA